MSFQHMNDMDLYKYHNDIELGGLTSCTHNTG